jgi:hypothetical protein
MSQWGNKDYANNVPKYLNTGASGAYISNSNVFLVDSRRIANATFGNGKAVAHQGWVKVIQGKGFVAGLTVANVVSTLKYSNTYLSFTGANTTPANAQIVVYNGNNVTIVLNSPGSGYNTAPTVTASGANNTGLIFTVVPGGRMGRVQAETLVALSNPTITDSANSGLPYFT